MNNDNNDKKIKLEDIIIFFYMTPFFIEMSLIIFIEGEITHFSGHRMIGIQARIFASFIFTVCIYVIYSVIYKLPLQNKGKKSVKMVFEKIYYAPFTYIFFITIILSVVFKFILTGYIWITLNIALLLICFVSQYQFIKEVKKYIE
jgi:hypothetical protein